MPQSEELPPSEKAPEEQQTKESHSSESGTTVEASQEGSSEETTDPGKEATSEPGAAKDAGPADKTIGSPNNQPDDGSNRYAPGCGCQSQPSAPWLGFLLLWLLAFVVRRRAI